MEESTPTAVPPAETSTVETPAKPATNVAQQQVAVPKRKRRDRIPDRPNYRFVRYSEQTIEVNTILLVSIYGVL